MTQLHFGVIDLHYADAGSYPKAKVGRPRQVSSGSMTTGDVAEILEERYHVMETFWAAHGQEIADAMSRSLVGAMEALRAGTVMRNPLGQASSQIERRFKEFLTNKEMDGIVPGVPTEASLKGHSTRFKRSRAARPSRPSFVDTGLYRGSFKSWVTT